MHIISRVINVQKEKKGGFLRSDSDKVKCHVYVCVELKKKASV